MLIWRVTSRWSHFSRHGTFVHPVPAPRWSIYSPCARLLLLGSYKNRSIFVFFTAILGLATDTSHQHHEVKCQVLFLGLNGWGVSDSSSRLELVKKVPTRTTRKMRSPNGGTDSLVGSHENSGAQESMGMALAS